MKHKIGVYSAFRTSNRNTRGHAMALVISKRLVTLLSLSVLLYGCGGGGSSSGAGGASISASSSGNGGSGCALPTVDIAGTWVVRSTASSNSCGEPVNPNTSTVQITQSGNNVSYFVQDLSQTFSGEICGDSFTVSGSYPEDGGTTTINALSGTFSSNSVSGTVSWSWSDGADSCSGTDTFVGNRL